MSALFMRLESLVTEASRPPTLTLIGLAGEDPRGCGVVWISGLGGGAAEPGVAVKCAILTPLCTNLTLAVEVLPLPLRYQ
jgi:hypothetical protein